MGVWEKMPCHPYLYRRLVNLRVSVAHSLFLILRVLCALCGENFFDAEASVRYHYREMNGYQAQFGPRNVERRRTAR